MQGNRDPQPFRQALGTSSGADASDATGTETAPGAAVNRGSSKVYRVVQWATGNVGTRSLRAIFEHPQLALVGVWVHSPDKIGRDAGALCGLSPVGVKATSRIEDILALQPDCVIYMPQGFALDDVCRLLSAGVNVVATRDEVQYAPAIDPGVRERIEAACEQGGSTLHATGSSPGFATEALPLLLTSLSRRVDGITIDEFADLSSRASPQLLFDIMGFGRPPSSLGDARLEHLKRSFGPSLHLVADALGMPLDGLEVKGEMALAREDVQIAAGLLKRGTLAATRITVSGMRDGRAFMRFRANWYCATHIDCSWELRDSGWRAVVDGDTPLDVGIKFPVAPEQYAAFTPGLTAHRAVNAAPIVCQAPPGMRSVLDLPHIVPRFD